jgi:hypothetical protein
MARLGILIVYMPWQLVIETALWHEPQTPIDFGSIYVIIIIIFQTYTNYLTQIKYL